MELQMNLHENSVLFSQAIRATAEFVGISEVYIEKDYWVTFMLYTLFKQQKNIGEYVVFKGGTALSKCYGLIHRFSEDIDLAVIRNEKETSNQIKKKLKAISTAAEIVLPELEIPEVTKKRGNIRKTVHQYPKVVSESAFGQIGRHIVVEATAFNSYEPFEKRSISTYIFEMMLNRGQEKMVETYGLLPFEIQTLDPKRTLCEKIMSLVRFSYSDPAIENLKKKIRHTYDLFCLLQQNEFITFLNSDDFPKMLLQVAADDKTAYKNGSEYLQFHPKESKIFAKTDEVWKALAPTYNNEFRQLVFDRNFPKDSQILQTLQIIREKLLYMAWFIS